jgi:hypothetical protein
MIHRRRRRGRRDEPGADNDVRVAGVSPGACSRARSRTVVRPRASPGSWRRRSSEVPRRRHGATTRAIS